MFWSSSTQNILFYYINLCAMIDIIVFRIVLSGASPGFGRGGWQEITFFRLGNLHIASAHGKAHALC